MQLTTRLVAAGIVGVLTAAAVAPAALAGPATTTVARQTTSSATQAAAGQAATDQATTDQATTDQAAADRTSAVERRRVDSVPTPRLDWYRCYGIAECATVLLPLDYDKPRGATTEIALLRIKARDQQARIGSLFVNPGGPGGLGTELAYAAPYFLGDAVLRQFDVVGFDPRGVGYSANIKCFRSTKNQTAAYAGLGVAFPLGRAEETAFRASAKTVGKGCSSVGKALAGAMSTAEAARDMDVLRRAVGEQKLSYLGFSYGSALGQYYAALFPDRVRSIVIDGVINPVSWAGTKATRNVIQDDRLRSADGAYKALIEILHRCAAAGETYCPFAAGDPVRNFEAIAATLRAGPLVFDDPDLGRFTVTYAHFIGLVLGALYSPYAGDSVAAIAADFQAILASAPTAQQAARASLARRIVEVRRAARGRDFPYNNGYESFSGVSCTDGLHPTSAAWPTAAIAADRRAPYFGRLWDWGTVQCARNTWTVRDEDAYTGPFSRRTSAPILVVGSYWDPATNYAEAVAVSRLLPNARLLSSNNWGHTGYGTSSCVTAAVDTYLLTGALPPVGTVCVGDAQPFQQALTADPPTPTDPAAGRAPQTIRELSARGGSATGRPKLLPPVTIRRAGSGI